MRRLRLWRQYARDNANAIRNGALRPTMRETRHYLACVDGDFVEAAKIRAEGEA